MKPMPGLSGHFSCLLHTKKKQISPADDSAVDTICEEDKVNVLQSL